MESHTNSDCSWLWVLSKHWRIHSFTLASSIHPFFETRREFGMTRSLGVRTPLKITFGGSLVPSAVTASATVKLCFSAPQVLTATVRLPVNSRERDEGSFEPHRRLVHVEDARQGISNSLPGRYYKPVKLHNFLFHVIWQSLGECCFCAEADRVASFPVLVPAK